MNMGTFVIKATKWPVYYISRPQVRVYGHGKDFTDGEFIKRPRMRHHHRLARFDPMTVCGMPGNFRKAFDMLEKDVPEGNIPEADMLEKDVAAENVPDGNMLEEDSEEKEEEYSEEEKSAEQTQDYVLDEDMSGEQRPEERSNEMFD
jgi:hypothetical protein